MLILADRYELEGDAESAERYRSQSADILTAVREAGRCRKCGRPVADGSEYGPDCAELVAAGVNKRAELRALGEPSKHD